MKFISEFDSAWPEMQRGCKAVIKAVDEGKNDEVASIWSDKSYFKEASKKSVVSINSLNDYAMTRHEATL